MLQHQGIICTSNDVSRVSGNTDIDYGGGANSLAWDRDKYPMLKRSDGDSFVITDGESDLYTKAVSRELVFTANRAGCAFVGRPLVEGTRTLSNFSVVAQILSTDEETAYRRSAAELVKEILTFSRRGGAAGSHFLGSGGSVHTGAPEAARAGGSYAATEEERPQTQKRRKLLVLHASIRKTSNTLAIWNRTEEYLKDAPLEIRTISLQNGTLYDCAGCPYHTCLHYGEQGSCFYGGIMAEEVYPAVREADALVMLCANYNDALAANLTAFINRLTALFRQVRFYDKALFAVVVSGYSGSDIVAEQLIAALNMNKTFYLPPRGAGTDAPRDRGADPRLCGEYPENACGRALRNLQEKGGRHGRKI